MACSNCTATQFAEWQVDIAEATVRINEIDDEIAALYSERADLYADKSQKEGLVNQCNMYGGPPQ